MPKLKKTKKKQYTTLTNQQGSENQSYDATKRKKGPHPLQATLKQTGQTTATMKKKRNRRRY